MNKLTIEPHSVRLIQEALRARGHTIGIDGIEGPETRRVYAESKIGVTVQRLSTARNGIPQLEWPADNQSSLIAFYGDPNTIKTVMCDWAYPLVLSWDASKSLHRFACHPLVKDSLERIGKAVLDHYGLDRILELRLNRFSGCYNKRRITGGTRWSTHAFGAAVDWDDANNKYEWGRDRATLAKPEYDAWWQIWESEGWLSLGRARNFDWMHVQAAG